MKSFESIFRDDERTFVFIDNYMLYGASRVLGFDVNYKKMYEIISETADLRKISFYANVPDPSEGIAPIIPLCDWLGFNGFTVVTKASTIPPHVEMATDIVLAGLGGADHIVIFGNDKSLVYPLNAIPRTIKVTTISTLKDIKLNSPDVRRMSNFVELGDIYHEFQMIKNRR